MPRIKWFGGSPRYWRFGRPWLIDRRDACGKYDIGPFRLYARWYWDIHYGGKKEKWVKGLTVRG